MGDGADREVLFEFRRVGNSLRVSAIDAATGEEVTVIGPAGADQADLRQLALRKLRRRLAAGVGDGKPGDGRGGGPGVLA